MSVVRDHLFGVGEDALEPGQFDTLDLLAAQHQLAHVGAGRGPAGRPVDGHAGRAAARAVGPGRAHSRRTEDGRVVIVSATPLGLERHDAIDVPAPGVDVQLLAAFYLDERRELAELLDRLSSPTCRRTSSRRRLGRPSQPLSARRPG